MSDQTIASSLLRQEGSQQEAWALMDRIYKKVCAMTPGMPQPTTAFYDFGVPILAATLSASRTNTVVPQQEQFIARLRLWWKRLDDSPKSFHAAVGAMLDDWESWPVSTEPSELAAAQARIAVLEGSIDYLRNVIDHPVTQEKTTTTPIRALD